MKKKLIAVVVLVVIIVAALPFLNGVLVERIVKKAVEDADSIYSNNPIGYSFEIVSYNRGYFATDLELKIDMGMLKDAYGIESIVIKEHAKHGYLGVVSTTSIEENAWYNSFVKDKLQGQDPLHIKTFYSLFGDIESTVILDDFTINIEGEKLHVKQGEIIVTADRKLKNIKVSVNWQGLDVGQKASLGEVSIVSDIAMISELISEGDTVINLKSLKVTDKNAQIEISGLKVHTINDVDKDANTIAGEVKFSIDSIQSKGNKIDDSSVRIAVKGIKLDAYEEFINLYLEMTSQMMSKIVPKDGSKIDEEAMKKEMAQVSLMMVSAYEKILKKDLEIQISDLNVKLPSGKVKGGITLRLLKDMTFTQFLPLINEPQMLLDVLYLETDVSLPIKLVGENPKMLQPVFPEMKTGLFVKDGDYLVNKMETKDGNLILNGNEVPLDKLRP